MQEAVAALRSSGAQSPGYRVSPYVEKESDESSTPRLRLSLAEALNLKKAFGAESRTNFPGPVAATGTLRCPTIPCGRADFDASVGVAIFRRAVSENFAFRPNHQVCDTPGAGIEHVAGG